MSWANKDKNTPAERARRAKYESPEHRGARKRFASLLERGVALACWRCGGRILPGSRWVVGHDDVIVSRINGPEHHTCNKTAADRKGALVTNAQRKAARFRRPLR